MTESPSKLLTVYRADVRVLRPDQIVPPIGGHIERMGAGPARLGEERLRDFSSHLRDLRSNYLFVYTTLYAATVQFIQFGGYVYSLKVSPEDVLHSADMKLVNSIGLASAKEFPSLAQKYADGDEGDGRMVELTVRTARMSEKVYDTSERESVRAALQQISPTLRTLGDYSNLGRLLPRPVPKS